LRYTISPPLRKAGLRLPELLPLYFAGENFADKRTITLRHLLMMRSGIKFDEDKLDTGVCGGAELLEGDVTALALSFPIHNHRTAHCN
jgi:CubicO group peptidase (beta-lactamase class C family)